MAHMRARRERREGGGLGVVFARRESQFSAHVDDIIDQAERAGAFESTLWVNVQKGVWVWETDAAPVRL